MVLVKLSRHSVASCNVGGGGGGGWCRREDDLLAALFKLSSHSVASCDVGTHLEIRPTSVICTRHNGDALFQCGCRREGGVASL